MRFGVPSWTVAKVREWLGTRDAVEGLWREVATADEGRTWCETTEREGAVVAERESILVLIISTCPDAVGFEGEKGQQDKRELERRASQ